MAKNSDSRENETEWALFFKDQLSAIRHVPKYSLVFLKTLRSPVLGFFVFVGNVILLGCILVFYHVEAGVNPKIQSVFDALWWGFVTVTTVGYGDIVPVTATGQVVALVLMVTGVTFFIAFTAVLVSVFWAQAEREVAESQYLSFKGYSEMAKELESIKSEVQELRRQLEKSSRHNG